VDIISVWKKILRRGKDEEEFGVTFYHLGFKQRIRLETRKGMGIIQGK